MKTLKELLFERHRQAEPGLDLARKEFLARLGVKQSPRPQSRGLHSFWDEYLLPLRWHLAGMSVVWLLVLMLHLDVSPAPAAAVARQQAPGPRQVVAALHHNWQEVLDLKRPAAAAPVALPPRRSEAVPTTALV
jgi:hypothetical protein